MKVETASLGRHRSIWKSMKLYSVTFPLCKPRKNSHRSVDRHEGISHFSYFFDALSSAFPTSFKQNLVGGFNHLKNISQNGNLPQIGVKIRNIWNHLPEIALPKNSPPLSYSNRQGCHFLQPTSRARTSETHEIWRPFLDMQIHTSGFGMNMHIVKPIRIHVW